VAAATDRQAAAGTAVHRKGPLPAAGTVDLLAALLLVGAATAALPLKVLPAATAAGLLPATVLRAVGILRKGSALREAGFLHRAAR
jgi:hypothetical protein